MDAVEQIARQRPSVLQLAEALGSVSEACRQRGMMRTSLYEYDPVLNAIEHRRTRVRSPQTNGFVERFH